MLHPSCEILLLTEVISPCKCYQSEGTRHASAAKTRSDWLAESDCMAKPTTPQPQNIGLIDREQLAARWCCSIETIKRMEKRGRLKRVQLGERMVRYRLADVLKLEESRA